MFNRRLLFNGGGGGKWPAHNIRIRHRSAGWQQSFRCHDNNKL